MVSVKKYNRDVSFEREMHNKYLSMCVRKQAEIEHLMLEVNETKKEYVILESRLEDYKEKYLDEQHKRLILAEKVEQLEMKLEAARECGYCEQKSRDPS
jgi:predicted RNase H-like nuclease (RuvC/YqgF family)